MSGGKQKVLAKKRDDPEGRGAICVVRMEWANHRVVTERLYSPWKLILDWHKGGKLFTSNRIADP